MVQMAKRDGQRRANLRLALVLASFALALGLGFVVKTVWWAAA
jgi:hypothetical protein